MTTTLEAHEPLTEGTHGCHGSEPVNDADEQSELEKLAALLGQTRAYRTTPIFVGSSHLRQRRMSSREADMTVMWEGSSTATADGDATQRPEREGSTTWTRAAYRAHALLSQTMSDEEMDELLDAAVPFDQAILKLPCFFFG